MQTRPKPVGIGDAVIFVDARGVEHTALVTCIFGDFEHCDDTHGEHRTGPSLNVVFVSDDPAKYDTYGRQIERSTSVVHGSDQAAHGMFWKNAI